MAADARASLFNYPQCTMELLRKHIWLIMALLAVVYSCSDEPVEIVYADLGGKKGVFIASEGNFMYGNSSLSFYDKVNKVVYNQVFYARNRAPLGDVAQSITSDGKNLYIVINNSGKIVVTDPVTLEFKTAITGLVSPRYIHFVTPNKAYVSDLYARQITIFNPVTLEKTGFIRVSDGKFHSTGHSTETFTQIGDQVFVTCWSNGNQLLIIDPQTDTVSDSISVPMQPKKMVADVGGKLWVYADGGIPGTSGITPKPALVRVDPETLTMEQIFYLDSRRGFSGDLQLNPTRDTLYVMAENLYKMPVSARRFPDTAFIEAGNRLFFSLGVDPDNGDIYLSDAIDYMQSALLYRYSSGGTALDSFRIGINPGAFWFN